MISVKKYPSFHPLLRSSSIIFHPLRSSSIVFSKYPSNSLIKYPQNQLIKYKTKPLLLACKCSIDDDDDSLKEDEGLPNKFVWNLISWSSKLKNTLTFKNNINEDSTNMTLNLNVPHFNVVISKYFWKICLACLRVCANVLLAIMVWVGDKGRVHLSVSDDVHKETMNLLGKVMEGLAVIMSMKDGKTTGASGETVGEVIVDKVTDDITDEKKEHGKKSWSWHILFWTLFGLSLFTMVRMNMK